MGGVFARRRLVSRGVTRWVTIATPYTVTIWLGPRRPSWSALHGWSGAGGAIAMPLDQIRLMGIDLNPDLLAHRPHLVRFSAEIAEERSPATARKEGWR